MISSILPLIVQLLSMTPQIVSGAENFVAGIEQAWKVATANAGPTQEEQAAYDAALQAAHDALQAS